jgi:hypothetical protein
MTSVRIATIVVGLLLLTGCVVSLHPVYTQGDIVFEPALVGRWAEGPDVFQFEKAGDKTYRLTYTDESGASGTFTAHLLKLDGDLYLDLFPEDPELKENDFYKMHIVAVHTFMRVKQISPQLQMAFMDYDWLDKLLEKTPEALKHEREENRVIVTASTKELQAFLRKYSKAEGFWGGFLDMKRVTQEAETEQEGAK